MLRTCTRCGRRPADGRMRDGTPIPICQPCKDGEDAALADRVAQEAGVFKLLEASFPQYPARAHARAAREMVTAGDIDVETRGL